MTAPEGQRHGNAQTRIEGREPLTAFPELSAAEPRSSAAAQNLDAEIAALEMLATHDLRIAWRRLHHSEPPTRLSRDLLVRAIAYRIQERAQGAGSARPPGAGCALWPRRSS
jgi:hypothetical protein